MPESKTFTEEELRQRLTAEQYEVTQRAGTERPFTGEYWDTNDDGTYTCIVCGTPLFSSVTKFDAGCGWPSFTAALDPNVVRFIEDRSHFMRRTEVRCATCDAHLGHIFPDGPAPTGDRYCMNSASLRLIRADDATPIDPTDPSSSASRVGDLSTPSDLDPADTASDKGV
jgi:peptide-methionine (R)-S-oxide reductase